MMNPCIFQGKHDPLNSCKTVQQNLKLNKLKHSTLPFHIAQCIAQKEHYPLVTILSSRKDTSSDQETVFHKSTS